MIGSIPRHNFQPYKIRETPQTFFYVCSKCETLTLERCESQYFSVGDCSKIRNRRTLKLFDLNIKYLHLCYMFEPTLMNS